MNRVCVICLEEEDDTQPIVQLDCRHRFHRTCIEPLRNDCCPCCRGPLQSTATLDGELVATMRKRKRQDAEERDSEAAEEVLCRHYIGPGTRRHHIALQGLLALCGLPERLCAMDARRVERRLHRGSLRQSGVSCQAVRNFIVSTQLMLRYAREQKANDNVDASLLEWVRERLPQIPPCLLREMLQQEHPLMERATIDHHIRLAWCSLVLPSMPPSVNEEV